ncbi:MAG: helix-turn-helix transcriptional regulator [Parabacteroides sp.]|jgi:AcrR family transcriptional regulator|nr:helix-turn-helix transcriptional regulator [Parabacteroides sp.]
MEKFFALDEKKQSSIINAALQCFGRHGYDKASINDIATSAGISKASVFQYFGNKQKLYEYLLMYCKKILIESFQEMHDHADLFDRVLASSFMEMDLLMRNPYISQFIAGSWTESAGDVQETLSIFRAETGQFRDDFVLKNEDINKFKNPNDAKAVAGILKLMAEGYAIRFQREITHSECERVMAEFQEMMEAIRRNFYKEEYLL